MQIRSISVAFLASGVTGAAPKPGAKNFFGLRS